MRSAPSCSWLITHRFDELEKSFALLRIIHMSSSNLGFVLFKPFLSNVPYHSSSSAWDVSNTCQRQVMRWTHGQSMPDEEVWVKGVKPTVTKTEGEQPKRETSQAESYSRDEQKAVTDQYKAAVSSFGLTELSLNPQTRLLPKRVILAFCSKTVSSTYYQHFTASYEISITDTV